MKKAFSKDGYFLVGPDDCTLKFIKDTIRAAGGICKVTEFKLNEYIDKNKTEASTLRDKLLTDVQRNAHLAEVTEENYALHTQNNSKPKV